MYIAKPPELLGGRRWIGFGVLPCVLQHIGKIGGPTEEDNGPTRRIERHGMGQTRKGSDVLTMRPMRAVKCPGFTKHRVLSRPYRQTLLFAHRSKPWPR